MSDLLSNKPLKGTRDFYPEEMRFRKWMFSKWAEVCERYGYGEVVEISHGNGYSTRYAHNKKNLVTVGEKIEKGEIVALMGATGRSTGTHVHFEVLRYGKHVNPSKYLSLN